LKLELKETIKMNPAATQETLDEFRERLAPVEKSPPRPRIYFEEWNDPLISGIAWAGELISGADGDDILPLADETRRR
jgi:iron complex transport system substrate-binding protein